MMWRAHFSDDELMYHVSLLDATVKSRIQFTRGRRREEAELELSRHGAFLLTLRLTGWTL